MYTRRKFNNIKSLLHFDFPYFGEPGDGLRDEASAEIWTKDDGVLLAGSEAPVAELATPKFGYRCAKFTGNNYIWCTNTHETFNLSTENNFEIEFFVKMIESWTGNIFALTDDGGTVLLSIALNNENTPTFRAFGSELFTADTALNIGAWEHVLLQMKNAHAYLYLNGERVLTTSYMSGEITPTRARLGGIPGYIDEFVLWSAARNNITVPAEPYQGRIYASELGGFGDAKHGNIIINTDCVLNSHAMLNTNCTSTKLMLASGWKAGRMGTPAVGDEVMILVTAPRSSDYDDLGCYAFRKISAVGNGYVMIDEEITDEFNLLAAQEKYYIQIIPVPNFNNFTLNKGVTVSALAYDNAYGGGLIIFRAKGTALINGNLISMTAGPTRSDLRQICNASLVDEFIMNKGGGIFIIANTIKAPSTARIGASWDGSLKGGTGGYRSTGGNGGSGYGGGGGGDSDNAGKAGAGGVGGGGGGADGAIGGNAGAAGSGTVWSSGGTGGGGAAHGSTTSQGGTQGVNVNSKTAGWATGGGGAGGNSEKCSGGGYSCAGASSGANVILIADKFSCDESAISTGGQGGNYSLVATGGGGTGFCYIAAKEMI